MSGQGGVGTPLSEIIDQATPLTSDEPGALMLGEDVPISVAEARMAERGLRNVVVVTQAGAVMLSYAVIKSRVDELRGDLPEVSGSFDLRPEEFGLGSAGVGRSRYGSPSFDLGAGDVTYSAQVEALSRLFTSYACQANRHCLTTGIRPSMCPQDGSPFDPGCD